jgi:hypothetical protein
MKTSLDAQVYAAELAKPPFSRMKPTM